ncbi:amino acid adenylation domain-containing protein [Streptomyces scopuliridis]|uniref:Pls/PosA family non-ribosomal peptide synthetase n=1 Tax=Streptomyces scopuliridis TaxID=452529 RepID=UPI002DD7FAFE|nr:Pls/PosA family non-ribosomal peptide synthetase [Streptomyces scopuliridis]WSB37116.1 amino acid adenylation domain-containing protein [Streptomyces scopuliridis]
MRLLDSARGLPSGGADRRLHSVFEAACDRTPSATALEWADHTLTYAELDARANQLAHFLHGLGIGRGARVAILIPRSVEVYVSLLGVGKAGAVFVPIDPASPPDRLAFIMEDAAVDLVLTTSALAPAVDGLACRVVELDSYGRELAVVPTTRPLPHEPGPEDGRPAAYIMYTSGSSGRPKGVKVAQSSICNFLDVVPKVYDVRPEDRVYQGMTISFDFSIEEIWPTWSVGATVVAGPDGSGHLGVELGEFLHSRRITMLYCVPTLLETIPAELPYIRSIVVGGEACPGQLVERWSRPGRRMLNTYGPTEATVTATWAELTPGRAVTIGRPLPTYSVVLLDERLRPVADGETGEICIGGPGVADGYVGRPELTADRFIEHPLAPRGSRLYRTGDLGRITRDGEVEFLGRADDEVKIRGYRVDLGEIDSVLLEDPGVAEAVTALTAPPDRAGGGGSSELCAYVVRAPGREEEEDTLITRVHESLRRRLPAYMVPSFLDILPGLPAMASGKVDRKRLPAPTGRRLVGGGRLVAAEGALETRVRDAWAEVLGIGPEALSAEADFFTDLGGHSLLAARVVSVLRGRDIGANTALRDLYAYPTVRGLAARLSATENTTQLSAPPRPAPIRHTNGRIAGAGAAQAGVIYLLLLVLSLPVAYVYSRHGGRISVRTSAQTTLGVYLSYLVVRWLVPVALVRPLSAGIRPGRYPLWGPVYIRLWVVNLLLSFGPLPVLSGSPMMAAYLRLLGARIGPRTTIATHTITLPALLRVGGDTSIGYGVSVSPWRVADGWVTVAPIEVGPHAFVGANAVLEPGARMGAGAGLGEQSVIGQDEAIPAGARVAGSPPRPVDALAPGVEAMMRAQRRTDGWRPRHLAAALAGLVLLETAAVAMTVPGIALFWWATLTWGLAAGVVATALSGPVFVVTVCCVVAVGKRLILRRVPVGIHPVRSSLGVRKWVSDKLLEISLTFTNSLYATLYTAPWLRLLGARIGRGAEVSTVSHIDPGLLTLRDGSFVADLANVGGATFAAGQVAFGPTEVGERAFIGNSALLLAGTRTGPGSLVGVGTVPPQGDVPDGTTWLGSPAIRLPVRQSSGSFPEELTFRPTRRAVLQRLGIEFFRITMPASVLAVSAYLYLLALSWLTRRPGLLVPVLLAPVLVMIASLMVISYCAAVKRVVIGVYRPRVEPLWSLFVRRTEFVTGLFEAAAVPAGVGFLIGTPYLPVILRRFGARIGRGTWIGTTFLTEFDLVDIGDNAAVGLRVSLQTHLFEDRVMKMSLVTVEDGASVGTRAVVLYDSVVGEDVQLGALSLLMKGEHLTPGTSWRGIPAEGVVERRPVLGSDAPARDAPAPDVRAFDIPTFDARTRGS